MRRPTALLLLSLLLVLSSAGAALADAAGPTNYRSSVDGIEPPAPGVEAAVFGGDAFLQLAVSPGTEVLVPGYSTDPEAAPYLRFAPDGTVYVNRRSPAAFLNDARYGSRDVEVPPDADALAPPDWEQVADGGTYAWHDHRIHWMSPSLPQQIDAGSAGVQDVFDWTIPLVIDGADAAVAGELVWVPSRSPVLPIVVALLAAAAAVVAVRREVAVLPVILAVGALAATMVGILQAFGLPAGATAPLLPALLPGIALAGVLAAAAVANRNPAQGRILAALSALPVVGAVVAQWAALTAPEVPTALPPAMVSGLLAAALGLAAGAAIAGVASLVTPLEADPATARATDSA